MEKRESIGCSKKVRPDRRASGPEHPLNGTEAGFGRAKIKAQIGRGEDGPNVKLKPDSALCKDIFWHLPHLIYSSLSARAKLRVSRSGGVILDR